MVLQILPFMWVVGENVYIDGDEDDLLKYKGVL